MTISRRKLVGAAGLLPPFAAAFTLSSAVNASVPETSDAESCSVAVIGEGRDLRQQSPLRKRERFVWSCSKKQHLRAVT